MIKLFQEYFQSENILTLDRAFLGLYSMFMVIKKRTKKRNILFPSITCPSPVFAAVLAGFTPVFTDVNLTNYLMDVEEAESKIKESEIACIVYIYAFGHSDRSVFKLRNLARKQGIFFIEDAAQAYGCCVNDREVGTIGDASVFSFGYSKQLDAGCGGLLLLNSDELPLNEIEQVLGKIKRTYPQRSLEQSYHETFYKIGKKAIYNPSFFLHYRTFPHQYKDLYFKKLQVNWENVCRKHQTFIKTKEKEKRFDKAKFYHRYLLQTSYSKAFILPLISSEYSIYRYTFLVKNIADAQGLSSYLRSHGINCSNLYIPVSRIFNAEGYPNAVYFARRVLNLWVDDYIHLKDMERTIGLIEAYFKNKGDFNA